MPSRRIAVVHHPRSFFPLDLAEQLAGFAEIVWVLAEECADDPALRRLVAKLGPVVDIAGLDADTAAARLGALKPDGIVTFVDDHLVTAAGLAQRLGLPYHSPQLAATLRDKRAQRAAFAEAGVPGPRFWPVPASRAPAALAELRRTVAFPCVLKPAEGAGSRGIHYVADPAGLLDTLAAAQPEPHIVEEYLPDDPDVPAWAASYVSVESVVSGGRVSHVAVTGRFPLADPFRETGNFIPALLAPLQHKAVLSLVDDAIDAVGVTSAVLHTEVKLTPAGPMLIEMNGRLGGRPPFVLTDIGDINLFRVACQVAAGEPVAVDQPAACQGVGFWLMIQPPVTARHLDRLDGLDTVRDLPGVQIVTPTRRAGQPVDWQTGTDAHILTIRGTAPDHDHLAGLIARIHDSLHITYT